MDKPALAKSIEPDPLQDVNLQLGRSLKTGLRHAAIELAAMMIAVGLVFWLLSGSVGYIGTKLLLVALLLATLLGHCYQMMRHQECRALVLKQLEITAKDRAKTNRLYDLSILDPLTALHNHRFGEQSLKEEIERSGKTGDSLAIVAFGLAPALRLTGSAPHAGRARSVFLACQVGASCILLIVSSQLVRSFAELLVLDPGFDYRNTLALSPDLSAHGYNDATAQQYFNTLRDRLAGIPGVQSVAVTWLPVWGNVSSGFIDGGRKIAINRVDAEFFATLNLRFTRGRRFNSDERNVAIVSESFARQHWHGEDPLGKALTIANVSSATVIGVVAKAGSFDIQDADALAVYYPILTQDYGDASIVIRVVGAPSRLAVSFIDLAGTSDPKLRPGCTSLSAAYDDALSKNQRLVSILGALGLLATLLAAIGLAGLTGYSVVQRTQEIGIQLPSAPRPLALCEPY